MKLYQIIFKKKKFVILIEPFHPREQKYYNVPIAFNVIRIIPQCIYRTCNTSIIIESLKYGNGVRFK